MKPETERWLARAAEDVSVAEFAWQAGYTLSCLFHLHQAIEKLLKAGLIERKGAYRKVHDLPRLAAELGLAISQEQLALLAKLTEQYIPSRYGDEPLEMPADTTENYYRQSNEFYAWLLQRLS
ncbi:MAG: HEPN domain-containing protein [Dehalococcoidia bacterium]|nr:HEPN domain-containing protein [Dehalococcoidia bacterium]